MTSGIDLASLLQPGMGGGMQPPMAPPEAKVDAIQLLTDALQMVRQATDAEDDPQMSVQLEQISTLLQKAIASDHADTLGSMGMKPGMARILGKAS